MSDEATIRGSLSIKQSTSGLEHTSKPTTFLGDVSATAKGPSPGGFTVAYPGGTDVDLSALTTPAYGTIQNLDTANTIHVGIYDPETTKFYPIFEVQPGEVYPFRISSLLAAEYGTGTGTTGGNNAMRVRPENAAVDVVVNVFDD